MTKPPLLHDNACGTSNLKPQTHVVGNRVPKRISTLLCRGILVWLDRIHGPSVAGLSASWKLLFVGFHGPLFHLVATYQPKRNQAYLSDTDDARVGPGCVSSFSG